jgi:hypothetical protein
VNEESELDELRPAYRSDRFEHFAAALLGIATPLAADRTHRVSGPLGGIALGIAFIGIGEFT